MKTLPSATTAPRLTAAVCAALLSARAVAASAPDDLSALDLESLMQMEITLVRAQKRLESADRVPIAMTVLKREQLRASGIESTTDLQLVAPGLTTSGAEALITPFIRGIGTDVLSSGIEPSVAVYVDGVYQGDRAKAFVDLADVEQVEILRGPQGTLFGRNATGGAINITTRAPSERFTADAQATAGNFDLYDASFFVGGPLADTMKLSLSGHVHDRAGTVTDIANGKQVYDASFYALNARAQVDLSETFSAELLAKYFSRDNSGGYATALHERSVPAVMGFQVATGAHQTASGEDTHNRIDSTSIALKLDWQPAGVRLHSISAWQDQRHDLSADADASTALMAQFELEEMYRAFTQELQLTPASPYERWDWLLGAFFLDSVAGMSPLTSHTRMPGMGALTQMLTGEIHTSALAVFADTSYALTPSFAVSAGLRLSTEEQDLKNVTLGAPGAPFTTFPARAARWDNLTYRLIAKYTLDDALLYAKTETGFKSGAFNIGSPTHPGPLEPEQITLYELGVKTVLPRAALHLNAALFYNDYRDLQLQDFESMTHTSLLAQAPKAETYGAEIESVWKANEHWTLRGGVSLLHAAYRQFTPNGVLVPSAQGGNELVSVTDPDGKRLSRSPQFTAHLSASYGFALLGGEVLATANYYRSSRVEYLASNSVSQPPFGVLNASLRYESSAGWRVSLWGNNFTGTDYHTLIVQTQLATVGEYAMRRHYGLSIGHRFGR